ncbi:hypothetical protein C1645_813971 [Glomus cerebriforme]|uniref:Uncharacterized protein n=1 Tax=Glomus cerebriforme TaxID=658196 RepID=A0A397TR87_9GLOM|nr:hypothetical protein C1645_813971 [Glomus cerebriforme]
MALDSHFEGFRKLNSRKLKYDSDSHFEGLEVEMTSASDLTSWTSKDFGFRFDFFDFEIEDSSGWSHDMNIQDFKGYEREYCRILKVFGVGVADSKISKVLGFGFWKSEIQTLDIWICWN